MFAGEGVGGDEEPKADDVEGVQGGDRGPARRQRRHAIKAKVRSCCDSGENGRHETQTSFG